MEVIKLSPEEARKMIDEMKKIIDDDRDCYLVFSHDLEKGLSIGKKKINKKKSKVLIANSKTIVLNKDEEEEDSFSTLSLYTVLQKDIFHIEPRGIKHDMILFN